MSTKNCKHSTCQGNTCRRPKENKVRKPIKRAAYKVKPSNKAELDAWFEEQRPKMKGICVCCGGRTLNKDDHYYRFSVAHVLPKKNFKSLAIDDDAWVELCYFGKGCHPTLDNMGYENCKDKEPKLFAIIVEKVRALYHKIPHNELQFIPTIILEELSKGEPSPF